MTKVVILAGGLGTRIAEETGSKPKPLVEIESIPIIVHLMRHYSRFKFREFIICAGYKGYKIKEFFNDYMLRAEAVRFNFAENSILRLGKAPEDWVVEVVDTGQNTMTGGRLLRVSEYIQDSVFLMTYGDGLSDININSLINFHHHAGTIGTITGVFPPGRFGALEIQDRKVVAFNEKPQGDGARINGGFFVFNRQIFDRISGDNDVLETDILPRLAADGELSCYEHDGFWHPMDTLRDKNYLEELVCSGQAPWMI